MQCWTKINIRGVFNKYVCNQGDVCMGMTRDNMAPRCDSSPFPSYKCHKRKRRWDVTPEDLENEKEELLTKQKWRKHTAAETVSHIMNLELQVVKFTSLWVT